MKHTIDLWGKDFPADQRWDRLKNARVLNVLFQPGTFGKFLKFFLDKFSRLSPDIPGEPFTETGTSHAISGKQYSGLIQKYHASFINDNVGETKLPICLIIPTNKKHYLYLKKSQWFRAGDMKISPNTLWQKPLGEMPGWLQEVARQIIELYKIKETAHFSWIPKFIVRDFYKLEFLQKLEDTYNYQWFETFKSHEFFGSQKVHHLDLETFFNWGTFIKNITDLDRVFELELDFDRLQEMKYLFDKSLGMDDHRKECNRVEEILNGNSEEQFSGLDVATEAYIYAEIEKANKLIQMPLTNRFFRDMEEIKQYIEHFPVWYHKINPNLG